MADKLKQMHWKKILLVGGILMVALVAGLCVQKPEGIKTTPLQPSEELKLSDFPKAFKSTLIIVGDNASEIEMQTANEIADYLENKTGNKALIKKYSEVSEEDKRNYNLIVVGTPKTNPFLEEVYAMTNATRVTEEFPGEGKGILEILPNPWNKERAMLLVEGWDVWGVKAGSGEIRTYKELKMNNLIVDFSQEVTIITDKREYKPQEEIKIIVSIRETDHIPLRIYYLPLLRFALDLQRYTNGEWVKIPFNYWDYAKCRNITFNELPSCVDLASGETYQEIWYQNILRCKNGSEIEYEKVPPGKYRFVFQYWIDECGGSEVRTIYSNEFLIVKEVEKG